MSVAKPEHLPPGGSSPTCKGYCCGTWGSGGTCPTSWQNTWRRAFPGVVVPECDGKEQPGECEVVLVRKGNKDWPDTSCSAGEGNWIFPSITCWTGNDLTSEIHLGVNTKVTLCKHAPSCRGGGKEYFRTETSGPKSVSFRGLTELYVECTKSDRCKPVTVDFDVAADGSQLPAGTYVEDEWLDYGLSLSAKGGAKKLPRLFDTANPVDKESGGGDFDLGAPNRKCSLPGPGIGKGGRPGTPGENCSPLGNVLIIQEKNDSPDISDDNASGGIITLDFSEPNGQYVYEIGLLDIDYATTVVVSYSTENGDFKEREITVPILGDNSKQTLTINQANVQWIQVILEGSGAITFLRFCPKDASHRRVSGQIEPGIENVELVITDSEGVVHTVTTDVNGRYNQVVAIGVVTIQVIGDSIPSEFIEPSIQISVDVPEHGRVQIPLIPLYHNECDPEKSFLLFDGHDVVSSMMMGEINVTWSPAFVLNVDNERFIWCGEYTYDVFIEEGTAFMNSSADFYGLDLINFAKEQSGVYHYETPNTTLIVKDLPNRSHSVLVTAKTKVGHFSFNRVPAFVEVASVDPLLNATTFKRLVELPRPDGEFTVELTDSNVSIFRGKIPDIVTDLQVGDFVNIFTSEIDVELGRVATEPQTSFTNEVSFEYVPSALSDMYDELDASVDISNANDSEDDYDDDDDDPELGKELAYLCTYLDENVKRHFCMAALPGSGIVDCFDENCGAVDIHGRRLGWWSRAKRYARRKLRQAKAALEKFNDLAKGVLEFIGNALIGKIDLSKTMTLFDIDRGATLGDNSGGGIGINFELSAKARFDIKIRIVPPTAQSSIRFYGRISAESYVLLGGTASAIHLQSNPLEIFRKSHTYKFVIPPAIPAWVTNELSLSSVIEASAVVESQIYASMLYGYTYEVGFKADLFSSPKFKPIKNFKPIEEFSKDTSLDQRLSASAEITTTLSWGVFFYTIFQAKLAVDLGMQAELEAGASLEAALATPPYFYMLDRFDLNFFIDVYGTVAVKLDISDIIEDATGVDVDDWMKDLFEKKYKLPALPSLPEVPSVFEEVVNIKEAIDNLLEGLPGLVDKLVEDATATLDAERLRDIAESIDQLVASLPGELKKAIIAELEDLSFFDIDTKDALRVEIDLRGVFDQVVEDIEESEDFLLEVLTNFEVESNALFLSLKDLLNRVIKTIEIHLDILDDIKDATDIVEEIVGSIGETLKEAAEMVIEDFLDSYGFEFDVGMLLDRIGLWKAFDDKSEELLNNVILPFEQMIGEMYNITENTRRIIRYAADQVGGLNLNLSNVLDKAVRETLSKLTDPNTIIVSAAQIRDELENELKKALNELVIVGSGVFMDVGFTINKLLLSVDVDNVLGQIKYGGSRLKEIAVKIRGALATFEKAVSSLATNLKGIKGLSFGAIDLNDILALAGLEDDFDRLRDLKEKLVGRNLVFAATKRFDFWNKNFLLLSLPDITLVSTKRSIGEGDDFISLTIEYESESNGVISNGVQDTKWFADFDGNLFEEESPWEFGDKSSKAVTVRIPMPKSESDEKAIEDYELSPGASIYLRATPTLPPLPYALFVKYSLEDLLNAIENEECCGREYDNCCGVHPNIDTAEHCGIRATSIFKRLILLWRECCNDDDCYRKFETSASTCSEETWTREFPNTGNRKGRIKGTVFSDNDGNGIYDPGEPGLTDVDVVITTSKGESFFLTTDDAGIFMSEVPAGVTLIGVDEESLPYYSKQTAGSDPSIVDVPVGGSATVIYGYYYIPG